MDYRYGGFNQMSASRGNDANGGDVSGESGNCGQRRHSSPARAKSLTRLEMVARRYLEPDFRLCLTAKDLRVAVQVAAHDRAWGNGRADLGCAAIADALNGSQP
jgi:hypothetical protein